MPGGVGLRMSMQKQKRRSAAARPKADEAAVDLYKSQLKAFEHAGCSRFASSGKVGTSPGDSCLSSFDAKACLVARRWFAPIAFSGPGVGLPAFAGR